jgi:hypothetical protein
MGFTWQLVATHGNVFGLFLPFSRTVDLPLIATVRQLRERNVDPTIRRFSARGYATRWAAAAAALSYGPHDPFDTPLLRCA